MLFYLLLLITKVVQKALKNDYKSDADKIGGGLVENFEISCLRNISLFPYTKRGVLLKPFFFRNQISLN